jgi:hypothetical protein
VRTSELKFYTAPARFPNAALSIAQVPLPQDRAFVECEIVARARQATGYFNAEGLTPVAELHPCGRDSYPADGFERAPSAGECTEEGVRKGCVPKFQQKENWVMMFQSQ